MTTETILTDDMSLIEQLREYAADNGYSHNDYADTMTAAADALEQAVLQSPEIQELRDALQFYADGWHFIRHDDSSWDTVSGEPPNLYEDEAGTATVEDGSFARLALSAAMEQQK